MVPQILVEVISEGRARITKHCLCGLKNKTNKQKHQSNFLKLPGNTRLCNIYFYMHVCAGYIQNSLLKNYLLKTISYFLYLNMLWFYLHFLYYHAILAIHTGRIGASHANCYRSVIIFSFNE